ncbi:MAG: hypothetical protein HDT38_06555 [Clostridiales bacterium]|nr:hypothetical protein [Clostridiales bacterium]
MPEETRTIGYICPVCGNAVIASRTAFQLAAGDSTLPCPCGKSELGFRQLGDRCEITVPCLFCAKDHTAVCGNDALLHRELLALSCPASGLATCYVGEEGQVFRAMEKLEAAVDKLRADDQAGSRGAFLNSVVMEETLAELRDIAQRGGVRCACGSGDYGVKVGYSCVDLVCASCGAALRLPAASPDDLAALCARDSLTIPGKKD